MNLSLKNIKMSSMCSFSFQNKSVLTLHSCSSLDAAFYEEMRGGASHRTLLAGQTWVVQFDTDGSFVTLWEHFSSSV